MMVRKIFASGSITFFKLLLSEKFFSCEHYPSSELTERWPGLIKLVLVLETECADGVQQEIGMLKKMQSFRKLEYDTLHFFM